MSYDQLLLIRLKNNHLELAGQYRVQDKTALDVAKQIMILEDYFPNNIVPKEHIKIVNGNGFRRFNYHSLSVSLDLSIHRGTENKPNQEEILMNKLCKVMLSGECQGQLKWEISKSQREELEFITIQFKANLRVSGFMPSVIIHKLTNFYPTLIANLLNKLKAPPINYIEGDHWTIFNKA